MMSTYSTVRHGMFALGLVFVAVRCGVAEPAAVAFGTDDRFSFVQYAPWCVWCIKLAPTWEAFAEEVEREFDGTMRVAKVRREFNLASTRFRMLCTCQAFGLQ